MRPYDADVRTASLAKPTDLSLRLTPDRCARRGKVERCVYHPAPLTKATSIPTPQHTSPPQSSPESNNIASVLHGPTETRFIGSAAAPDLLQTINAQLQQPLPSLFQLSEYAGPSPDSSSESTRSRAVRASSVPVLNQVHDLRATDGSHRQSTDEYVRYDASTFDKKAAFVNDLAVLAENELSIGILPPRVENMPLSCVSQLHIDKGATVLTLLKDFPTIQKYMEKWFSFVGGFVVIRPIVKIFTDGIWASWHKTLESQKPADLRRMSESIWQNTLRPASGFLNRRTTPKEFCANMTGEFVRWEVIGLIVTLVSMLAQHLKGNHLFL